MTVLINRVPIDAEISIQSAKTTDSAGGRGDLCEVILPPESGAETWTFSETDCMEIADGGYSTGQMRIDETERLSTGEYAIRATSLPAHAKETGFSCYEYVTLDDLLRDGAKELGMEHALYGVDGRTQLRRIVRRNQSWPAFLNMVMRAESATIKFFGNTILAIGYDWAFAQVPARVLEDRGNGQMIERPRTRMMRVASGLIEGRATDIDVTGSSHKQMYNEQVYDDAQAKRMARGLLLENNIGAQVYRCEIPLDTHIAAMSRIDMFGTRKTEGNWFVSSVTHDFTNRVSRLTLKRCITSIK